MGDKWVWSQNGEKKSKIATIANSWNPDNA
jgi:hypothetical protein